MWSMTGSCSLYFLNLSLWKKKTSVKKKSAGRGSGAIDGAAGLDDSFCSGLGWSGVLWASQAGLRLE